jgi:putative DNA primase/helicase
MSAPVNRQAAQLGWYEDGHVFVECHGVIGTSPSGQTIIPTAPNAREISIRRKRCGKPEGFTKKLAPLMRYSSVLVFAVCAVFACALLARLNRGCVGFVLSGPSRLGKSTVLLYAASLLGFGEENELLSLNATKAGLLSAARSLNDHLTPINEIGAATGKKSKIYDVVRDRTYQLMEGQDIVRHHAWEGDAGMSSSTFRSIFLFTSEYSPDQWAARSGAQRDDGERARLIGIPVGKSIFDKPPRRLQDDKEVREWTAAQFSKIRRRVKRNRGHAFSTFVEYLMTNPAEKWARVEKYKASFADNFGIEGLNPVETQFIDYVSILHSAGALASDAGLIPVSRKRVGEALTKVARAAIGAMPDDDQELRQAIRRLRNKIEKELVNVKPKQRGRGVGASTAGWLETKDGTTRVVIRAKDYIGWSKNPLLAQKVLEWCEENGLLAVTTAIKRSGRGIAWAERQITWPNGTRVRSIEFVFPNGLGDLKLRRRRRA